MTSFKVVLGVLFLLLISAITVLEVISYYRNEDLLETTLLVRHTYEVLDRTDEISSLYKDLQLESNAFLIRQDSTRIGPYLSARKEILPLITQLSILTADNPPQQVRVDSLFILVKMLAEVTDSVLISGKRQYTKDEIEHKIKISSHQRERIRRLMSEIRNQERSLLADRERENKTSIADFRKAFFLLMFCIAVLLAATFFSIRYNFNKRMLAQEELKRANELFVKLFYESPIGIVITNMKTGKVIDCNNAYTELVNFEKSEIIDKTAAQLGILAPGNPRNEIIKRIKAEGIIRDMEVEFYPKNADPIWASVWIQSINVNNETCLLNAILNMTTHKKAEEKMRQALDTEIELNKLKSNFVTLASHEFRTPLTAILSSAFLLDSYSVGDNREKISRHISRIKASVNLLTSILDEFLSLTKIEEGKVKPRSEKMNLREMLESLCNNFKALAKPGQHIILHHTGDEEIYSDPVLLGNIFNNLVSNAIKYSPENSEIIVSSLVNGKVQLAVKDSGIGISPEDRTHLFERFFRASNTGAVQGTGLGLYIMKHYVNLLNGCIEVQSEKGKGSEFKVTFDQLQPES